MEEEIFEIVEEGTEGAEQVTVVKVFCKHCPDYELHTPEEAKRIEADFENFQCKNCYVKDGRVRSVTAQDVCGVCHKPFSRTGPRVCYCPVRKEPGIKITNKNWKGEGKDPKIQRVKDEIEHAKAKRIWDDKVKKAIAEPEERQKRIEKSLEKISTLLELQDAKQDLKEINHGAIG